MGESYYMRSWRWTSRRTSERARKVLHSTARQRGFIVGKERVSPGEREKRATRTVIWLHLLCALYIRVADSQEEGQEGNPLLSLSVYIVVVVVVCLTLHYKPRMHALLYIEYTITFFSVVSYGLFTNNHRWDAPPEFRETRGTCCMFFVSRIFLFIILLLFT